MKQQLSLFDNTIEKVSENKYKIYDRSTLLGTFEWHEIPNGRFCSFDRYFSGPGLYGADWVIGLDEDISYSLNHAATCLINGYAHKN